LRLILALLAYTLIGFLLVPVIIRWQMLKQLPRATHRQAVVRQVRFNPYALSLTIRGFALMETNQQPFIAFEEMYANFQLSSAFRLAWTFQAFSLSNPVVQVSLNKQGQWSFADLLTNPAPAQAKSSGLPPLIIEKLDISGGSLSFSDESRKRPFRTTYAPMEIHLNRFTTRLGKDSPYAFTARGPQGASLSWSGQVSINPPHSTGGFKVTGMPLDHHSAYLDEVLPYEVPEGRFDVAADYHFDYGTNGVSLEVTNAAFDLWNLRLTQPQTSNTVATLAWLGLRQGQATLANRSARFGTVTLTNLVLKSPDTSHTVLTLEALSVQQGSANLTRQTAGVVSVMLTNLVLSSPTNGAAAVTLPSLVVERVDADLTNREAKVQSVALANLMVQSPDNGVKVLGLASFRLEQAEASQSKNTAKVGAVHLEGLRLKTPNNDETVATIPSLVIRQAEASAVSREARVGQVETEGGSLLVRQSKDGTLNLLSLIPPGLSSPPETNSAAVQTNAPWVAAISNINVQGYSVRFEDLKPAKPASLKLDQIAAGLKNVSTRSNSPLTVLLSMLINDSGSLVVTGAAQLFPLAADMQVGLTNLDLCPFQPYVEEQVKMGIKSGSLTAGARVHYAASDGKPPSMQFAGDLQLTHFASMDTALFRDLVKWDSLQVNGLAAELPLNSLEINEVRFTGLKTSVVIGADHQPRFKTMVVEKAPAAKDSLASSPAAPTPAPKVKVATLALEQASLEFADQSIQPECNFGLQEFGVTIHGLSSEPQTAATLDVRGKVDDRSPFWIVGKVNPLAKDMFVDLAVSLTNMDLTAFTPYLERYGGYPLNKGKLSLALNYLVQKRSLQASNGVMVDHLTLGSRNNSTNATKLPLKLAVALLKDVNGRIELDLPLTGSLDDPQFGIGRLVLKVLMNMLVKAVASPFKLLGALVGGGEELSFVAFDPGTAEVKADELPKLEKLATALQKRPALNLEIAGSVDLDQDRAALQRQRLLQQAKALRLKELAAHDGIVQSVEDLSLDPTNYARLVKTMFLEMVSTNPPLEMLTNASRASLGTNRVAEIKPAAAGPAKRLAMAARDLYERGATLIMQGHTSRANGTPGSPTTSRSETAAGKSLGPPSALGKIKPTEAPGPAAALAAETPLEDIETRLASQLTVTDDELRNLMQERAKKVEAHLIQAGQIAPERVFRLAPKPFGQGYKGETRVNLSLN